MSIECAESVPMRGEWRLPGTLLSLIATRRRMRFSNASYICIFVFFSLHAVGAHYTYSLVPHDRWFTALTGSPLYEVVEWLAASIVAPDRGDAYLGTQGDQWDAQKDMALAAAGAVLSMLVLRGARSSRDHAH